MDERVIAVYCLCDDCLKALHHHEDVQRRMSGAEVMTTALVAALFFRGNFESGRKYLKDNHFIPNMLGKSRFNRLCYSKSTSVLKTCLPRLDLTT